MITVEQNIPFVQTGKGVQKYPFKEMNVSDSFACEPGKHQSVYLSAYAFAKRHRLDWKFSVRKDPDTGLYRCWRVA